MRAAGLVAAVAGLLLLHQDTWFWLTPRPLVLGFLPPGLFYHGLYTVVVAVFMLGLVRYAWPSDVERRADLDEDAR